MKNTLTFIILALFSVNVHSQQIIVQPSTLPIGKTTGVVFSGSGINFSQGTCIYVFLVQGTKIISQNASSTYQSGTNFISASFTVASNIVSGLWDIYIVDVCSSSWTGSPLNGGNSVLGRYLLKMNTAVSSIRSYISSISKFDIFPNPVKKGVDLSIESSSSTNFKNHLIIRDLQGKSVYSTEYKGSSHEVKTSNLESGIYFVEIFNDLGEKSTKKIVVE